MGKTLKDRKDYNPSNNKKGNKTRLKPSVKKGKYKDDYDNE